MQQEPVAKITGADEYGPMLQWSTHWVALIGANLYAVPPLTPAARDVLAERRRQVEVEGFTSARDDEHCDGTLSAAAGSYALHAFDRRIAYTPAWWPWQRSWWKPGTPRQMLVKAGALILAAIEQIDRRAAKTQSGE
ncbi:hypothetical protein [Burkholderia cenocepacia]|uniref:hypothetical protein n=1 Tax=Burkholderia cenocepacia TaxID=95486 RepID=UPI000D0C17FB|nr:hypothetical protein [Burkholderia cenocepacia]SOT39812.1 hypothetical protein F01_230156 [Burkholderia cenocepacia]